MDVILHAFLRAYDFGRGICLTTFVGARPFGHRVILLIPVKFVSSQMAYHIFLWSGRACGMCARIGMTPFRENAFYLFAWRAFLAALIGLVLMVTRTELAAAFLIGADVALLFSCGLIVWSDRLTEERVVWTQAWRMLQPTQRPAGWAGRRWAHRYLSDMALRFAEGASALAIALSASAFIA